jgi:hypothetical protein
MTSSSSSRDNAVDNFSYGIPAFAIVGSCAAPREGTYRRITKEEPVTRRAAQRERQAARAAVYGAPDD